MSITLYWHPMSSAVPAAAALLELDVPHERVKVDIRAGEQRLPEFLALNPNGKVPTLVVDGAPMFETLAIHLYLGERFGVARGLWPEAGTAERLQAMSWCTWAYVTYGTVLVRRQIAIEEGGTLSDPTHAAAAHRELDELLGLLEARLSAQPWMLGQAYTLVDLVVSAVIGYSAYLGAPVERHARVSAWLGKVQARPAVQAADSAQ